MKKFLLSFLFFLFTCTSVWGDENTATYKWTESTKTLTIKASGFNNGEMGDYGINSNKPAWKDSYKSTAQHLIIEDGITTIGTQSFNGFEALKDVVLPSSLHTIKQGAFTFCISLAEVRFKGSPNEWASIDFQSSDESRRSQPFYANVNKAGGTPGTEKRKFAFYYTTGSAPNSVNLEFTSAINEINPYAFYGATNIVDVYIPGTVSTIGDQALDCGITRLYINKKVAPSTGTSAITWTTSSDTYLYLRSDATNSYNTTPWYHSGSAYSDGARYLGYNSDHASIHVDCSWKSGRSLYNVSGTEGSITWTLSENGTLSLNGTGAMPRTYTATYNDENVLPWYRFRYLINKIVIQGGITGLTSALSWAYGLCEIDINQNTIPTSTTSEGNINNNFNTRDNIVVKVKVASLADASASNLGSAPWNNAKLDIQLSDNVVISDNADYSTILANCSTYVEAPITLQLGRTLTDAQYNTFCSPIDLTAEQLNYADIRALESSSLDGEDLTLTFSASSLDAIEAGKPYLVKPSSEVANPTFENIAPSSLVSTATNTETDFVDFIGVLAPTPLTGGNKNTLFLGAGNELFWPEADGNIKGMRAYFSLKGAAPGAKRARIVMNKEAMTDIETVRGERLEVSGRKILRNGQILIIRDGKEYNVMGIMMK